MSIDWWTLGLQAVNLVVLIWILARFLFRPISRIIADRQTAAVAALNEAEAASAAAASAREAAEAEAAAIMARRSDMIAEATREAETEVRRILDEAREAAAQVRAEGAAELDRTRREQQRALSRQAVDLAADIAAKLLSRLPDSARIAGFEEGLAEAVADLPEASRRELSEAGPLTLRAARDLTGAERDLLDRALQGALGQTPELVVDTDPSLIAGLELVAPHAIVRNHLRADLDHITEELTRND